MLFHMKHFVAIACALGLVACDEPRGTGYSSSPPMDTTNALLIYGLMRQPTYQMPVQTYQQPLQRSVVCNRIGETVICN